MNRSRTSNLLSLAAGLRRLQTVALAFLVTFALAAPDAFAQKKPPTFSILPITVTDVTLTDVGASQLTFSLSGLIGTNPFEVPLIVTAQDNGAVCPILNLQLAPIHLSVLGLNVDTSAICLRITAFEGGGLLGDLLCAVANLLNDGLGLDLGTTLTPAQIADVENALLQVVEGALDQINSSASVVNASCNILNLALGPLTLDLLGLVVELDDCAAGPVTVDITATPGGGLLGDLLCDLGDLLNSPGRPNQQSVLALLRNVVKLIGGLLG